MKLEKGITFIETLVLGVIILVVGFIIFAYPIAYLSSCTQTTFTVESKERINKNNDSYYLVFTDKEVFKNEDSILKWKWNSSDVYGELKQGQKYTCEVCGWRIRFLSMYRNITNLK
jgi:hypothetical protein